MNAMRYAVVIEKSENNFGARVPDLPGCVATAKTATPSRRPWCRCNT